jgi:DNA-binding NarL/FixJ family response regulator
MSLKAPRILVVDDQPLVRDGLRAAILAAFPDALVEEAANAPEGLAKLAAHRPDLVLLDVYLPGENGLDLARRIRAADKHLKMLMVAGEADPWTVNEALAAGASGFVTKTRSADFLGQAMKAVLEGQRVLCPDAQAALQRAEPRGTTATEPPGPSVLSAREREVLKHLAQGENTKTIASVLQISPKTVETHRQHIMRKLGSDNVAALTHYAIRHGLTLP